MSAAPKLLGLLALAAAALATSSARAQPIDLSHGGPVQVNAAGGIDWEQNQQVVIAHGDARAVRGDVTVTADQLIAHYRKKATTTPDGKPAAAPPPPAATPGATTTSADSADDTSGTEVYRLEAIGHVHIFTQTDQAFGDHAIYDMDQSVLVLTGQHLKLITPQDVLTARDSMEDWPQRHMSVARGAAVVVTNDGRRIAGDVLVAFRNPNPPQAQPAKPAPANPIVQVAAKPPADPLLASGKLERVEAYGNVDVRTPTETIHGDRGVYVADTDKARIVGHVRSTRGQNQLNGSAANVNMKTGVATMVSGHDEQVNGLIVPSDAQSQSKPAPAKPAGKPVPAKPGPAKNPGAA
jgi:lipopolysaccharide export system protein LptA